MLDEKVKNLLEHMANDIRNIYNFSLVPTDPNYKSPEKIVEDMEGGLLFLDVFDSKAARCGNSFLLYIQKEGRKTDQLRSFAQGLSILFLQLKFQISDDDFLKNENMKMYNMEMGDSQKFEQMIYFANELMCPKAKLREVTNAELQPDGTINIKSIANKLGLDYSYVESQLVNHKMIHPWYNR